MTRLGYWNAHSDRDYEDGDRQEWTELDQLEDENRAQRERINDLQETIQRLSTDLDAAIKWAAEYERQHGPFKNEPRQPDFLIAF